MAGKNAAGEKVTSVAAALKERAKRMGPPKKTVQLRAIQRGYYGRPLPDLIDAGMEFPFVVADLEAVGKHAGRDSIEVEGAEYELPTWCEDARKPATIVRDEDEDEDENTSTNDVI